MKYIFKILVFTLLTSWLWSCKSKDDDKTTPATKKYALVIKSGGQAVKMGDSFAFEAQLVGTDGTIIPITSGITYTSSATGVATITGNSITGATEGTVTVTASYVYQGTTFTASVPVVVQPPQTVFAVNPWTIWWEADGSEFELNTIYLGLSSPTFTFTSSDPSIASVSATGVVKALKAGSCVITVEATNLEGKPKVQVPVLLFGEPTVALPVSQVKITPGSFEMFKGEDKTFTAKAYKSDGSEVTGKTVKWWIKTTDSSDTGPAASVDQSGKVTAIRLGEASVYAEIEGIVAQANITINPEYALFIEPFTYTIKAGESKTFTLKTYKVDKEKYRAGAANAITLEPTNPANVKWILPFASIPGIENPFTITSQNGNECVVKANSPVTIPLPGFLLAYVENDDKYAEGGASIMTAIAEDCNCGADHPGLTSITTTTSTINLSMSSGTLTADLGVKAFAGANELDLNDVDLVYCSDSQLVASAASGTVTAAGPGTATITICAGSIKKTVTVNVTL